MKINAIGLGLAMVAASVSMGPAQAQDQTANQMQSAQPIERPGESEEQHGQRLLSEMVAALGGEAWLNKQTVTIEGQTAAFFQGQPTGSVVRFVEQKRFAQGTKPELSRVSFLTVRGVIVPGMKKDIVHLWTADSGYEFTFKGRIALPQEQVTDYMRRRAHSIDEVMRTWVKAPGVAVIYEGIGTRDRHQVDKVSILSANNDAVTIELDHDTHLPLDSNFKWRNEQFKDYDQDDEVYGDWRAYQGIQTPMNVTRYHNDDMADQTFYTKVTFNQPMADSLFDPDQKLVKH